MPDDQHDEHDDGHNREDRDEAAEHDPVEFLRQALRPGSENLTLKHPPGVSQGADTFPFENAPFGSFQFGESIRSP
jgi:hypothetical protein